MTEKDKQKEEFRKRLYRYSIRMLNLLDALSKGMLNREIISQLMRSSTSIGANYFEAEAASSKKDFRNFFNHSLKSANESKFWLKVLYAGNLIPNDLYIECEGLFEETKELAKIFASSILTMKGKRKN